MKKFAVLLSLLLGIGLVFAGGAYALGYYTDDPGAFGWPTVPPAKAPAAKAPVAGETGVSSSAGPPAAGQPIPPPGQSAAQPQVTLPPGHPPVGTAAIVTPGVMASDMIGSDVVAANGQAIGTVDDLVVNPASGRVAYALIEPSNVPGIGTGQLLAVPVTALRQSPGQDQYVLNIDTARLSQAPTITRENMPRAVGDVNFNNQVRDFFNQALPGTGSGGGPGGP